ncbi:DUF2341 domain-containing protein, partial [Candidatus Woesearchaeota archaeon]|nr:DUF2341 domain-containing protein [Candidatus Woesearchaeota archaeon]
RNEITARVKVNGQILPSCYANTYLRAQTQNVYDGGIDSGCLLNLTAGDELAVNLVRTGGNYITKVTANRTHIDLRRLNHDDVFIAHDSGGGQDTNQVAGKNLTWDTLDVNGSSFNFTIDGEGVTVASDGLYRVMYGIDTYQTGGRYAIYGEILVNGQPQTQGYYVGFSRSNDGTNNAIAATEALIELNSGDEIKIRAGRASSDSRTVTSVGNHTWFHIERVSDNQGMVFIAHKEGTREDINSATGQLINFDTVDRQDAWFSQTDAETVQVLQDGAYYLYYSVDSYYAAGNTRWSGYSYVEVNGADNETCWGSSYVRGYPSSGGQIAEDSMGSGCILELQANDNLSIRAGRLSTGSIATTDYENRTWMFIMALDAIGIRPNVTSLNANPATVEFGGNVNVSADVVDNTAVDTVLIEIEEPDSTKTNYTTTNTSSVHWNDTFTPTQLGTHTFKIYANDTNGWTNNSETNTFSVQDTTKPSVSSLNNVPATGELAQFINLSADVSDTHGVQTVVIEVTFPDTSKQNYTTLQTSGSYWNATINTTQKGTYTFRFYANDSSGNMNSTETDTFTVVDTTVPAVSTLNAQPDPIDVPNQINISTIIRDHGTIDTVIIELTEPDSTETNLTTLQIGDSFYNQSFTTGQNGVHTYRIYANDTDGNMNSSETGTFEVKSDPNSPVVIALDAVPDPVTTYDTVNISLNATDSPSGVDIVIIEIAEPDGTKTNYSTKNISATFWNQSIPTSQNGIHTYRIYANDTVRNMNGSETSTFLATETEIPSVTALNDNPDPVEFNNTINLNATITDNVDVHIVLIEVEFPDTSKVNYTTTKTGDVYWNESIDTTKLGLHTYKIYSNDTANNRNDTESSTFTVQDTENPNVTAVTANQSLVILSMDAPSNIINLSATITDNAYLDTILIEVTFPDTSKQNFTTENVGDTYWNHSILITLNGTHTFRFIVNDTAGNTNVTETGTFDALKYGYLTVVLVNPLTDRNVTPNEFFNFTVNVTCLSGFCGDVNVSLDPQGNWWNDSFIHRRRIDLNNSASSESHTNFTILIKLDSTTIDYTHTNNDGSDIRFVDWDNTTVLGHDIELWNESGTSFVWVKIPTLDTSGNDSFWMYYGNESVPMANTTYAWKSNYAIVYHMDSSGNDSTDNDRDRVSTAGTPTYDVDFLGHEATFGTGNGWSLADISYWEAAWDERTHLVVFTTGTDIITDAAVLAEGGGTNGMGMYIIDGLLWANWWTGSNICTLNTSIAINTQYHVSMSYDNPGNCSLYVNGTRNQTGTTSTQVGGHTGNGGVGYPVGSKQLPDGSDAAVASFDGTIHEVHVFDSPESDAWHASMQRNLEDNIVTGVSQEVTKSKGLVSTVVSDLPFYTTDANPLNKTHDACLASMQWGDSCELTWSVNATGAIDSWFEFFAFALSNETRVDRNDTAKLNLTIQQNAGPPIIENVTSISPVTPLLAQNVTVLVNFTVSDIEGVDDLNDSSATVVFSRNGITRTGSCTPNDLDATTTVYNCSAVMTHYDPPGMWTVNVSVSDNRDWNASNATTSFTYNVLDAISLSTASYSFGSLNPGATAAGTDNPFRIDNQGNLNYTGINITAYNLINVSYIDVSNLTVNVSNALGTLLNNASSIIVPNAILEPDTNTGDRNESLYFYINVPAALPAGDYVASQNWEVISYE